MVKRLLIVVSIAFMMISCGTDSTQTPATEVTVAQLTNQASEYVGQTVSVTGTVQHVCRHGGQRMFIMGDTPEARFKITPGPDVGAFDVALEGSDVRVQGVVEEEKVDRAYLDAWEAELGTGRKPEVGHEGHDQGVVEEDEHEDAQKDRQRLENMRQQLEESGKEALYFYSLDCHSFEELD